MTVSCGIVDFHSFFFALTQKKNVKKITDAFPFETANIEKNNIQQKKINLVII